MEPAGIAPSPAPRVKSSSSLIKVASVVLVLARFLFRRSEGLLKIFVHQVHVLLHVNLLLDGGFQGVDDGRVRGGPMPHRNDISVILG